MNGIIVPYASCMIRSISPCCVPSPRCRKGASQLWGDRPLVSSHHHITRHNTRASWGNFSRWGASCQPLQESPIPLNWSNNGLSDIRLNRVYPSLGRGRARARVAAINYPSISVSLGRSWWSRADDTEWTIQTQLQVRDGLCQPRWSMARVFPHTAQCGDEKSPNLSQCCSIANCTMYIHCKTPPRV